MHHLAYCHITLIRLKWQEKLAGPPRAHQLRGAIIPSFPDEPIFHQHEGDGFIYRYPLVHYRWYKGDGIVVGFNEGADKIVKLPWLDIPIRLSNDEVKVSDTEIYYRKGVIGVSDKLEKYRFLSPWVPLNQDNHKRYQSMNPAEQCAERDRLLVAQLLTALRGLRIDFPERLYAAFNLERSVVAPYKDQALTGFLGEFVSNVILPDHFAVGRSVSHGYGWFVKA